jgi:D-3-phosphoglycerate dehydrogenase
MEALAYDPYLSTEEVLARGATKVELGELLERADFVQLNCPLTPETEGLMGREQFTRMKPTAFFVTTARGAVHDEAALYDALVSGAIAGAGIDVFHEEPPDPAHPLLTLDNVVASPHTAGITVEATRAIARATAEQWLDIFAGKVPPRVVNPQAWPEYSARFEARLGVRPEELPS